MAWCNIDSGSNTNNSCPSRSKTPPLLFYCVTPDDFICIKLGRTLKFVSSNPELSMLLFPKKRLNYYGNKRC